MTNQEILEKAIIKAIDGGFDESKINETELGATGLIFRKDFAKALWGRGGKAKMHYSLPLHWGMYQAYDIDQTSAELEEWQYHLQMMVVSDDPIAYLGASI